VPFEIPESWQWVRLGELITTKTGLAYSKPNLEIKSNNMIRVLRGGNIANGSWQMKADDVMISSEFVKPDLYLRQGYFITPAVTSWENMGKTALVREDYEDVVVGGFVLMMCPFYTDGILEEYLNYFFQSTLFQQYCRNITNKSGQAFYNLSRNKLLQLLVPVPPIEEQQRIYRRLDDALASIMSR
jgi:type I restriction enzyme S subunit